MRSLLLAAALLGLPGCFFPTPLLTPEPLPAGQTRVEGSVGTYLMTLGPTAGVNVRTGVGGGWELSARVQAYADVEARRAGAILGGGASRLLRAPTDSASALSAHVGGSVSFGGGETLVALYPTLLAGDDHEYYGLRTLVLANGDDAELSAGPVIGFRKGDVAYWGGELAVLVSTDGGAWVLPAVTFGVQPRRAAPAGQIPAPAE